MKRCFPILVFLFLMIGITCCSNRLGVSVKAERSQVNEKWEHQLEVQSEDRDTRNHNSAELDKPEGVKDMPGIEPVEDVNELETRVNKKQKINVVVYLSDYMQGALESFGATEDVSVDATIVTILTPSRFANLQIKIFHSIPEGNDSYWRKKGTKVSFDINARLLEILQSDELGYTIYQEDLENICIVK